MNTKASVGIGWASYTVAFIVGGGLGYHRYYNGPGGRKEREEEATRVAQEREREEAAYEERIRSERVRHASGSPTVEDGSALNPVGNISPSTSFQPK
jgi:hypothetical protein